MAEHSQNGWLVVGKSACDQGPFQGALFPNGILAGDVTVIARWQLARYAREVEPVVPGTCWGWFVKPIEGTATISNHASATAWDINADQHNMGDQASKSMSSSQIAACRAIVADSHGTLRWGGMYTGRPDPMHWEIIGTPAQVAAFAEIIRSGGDNMLVKKGDTGEGVKFWQYVLLDLGYSKVVIDGVYGPVMEAAVNDYRHKTANANATTAISGWTAWSLLTTVMVKRAGKNGAPGTPGKDGAPGAPGKDGTLTGALTVTGGTLTVRAG
jgi:hypothetical protein